MCTHTYTNTYICMYICMYACMCSKNLDGGGNNDLKLYSLHWKGGRSPKHDRMEK